VFGLIQSSVRMRDRPRHVSAVDLEKESERTLYLMRCSRAVSG